MNHSPKSSWRSWLRLAFLAMKNTFIFTKSGWLGKNFPLRNHVSRAEQLPYFFEFQSVIEIGFWTKILPGQGVNENRPGFSISNSYNIGQMNSESLTGRFRINHQSFQGCLILPDWSYWKALTVWKWYLVLISEDLVNDFWSREKRLFRKVVARYQTAVDLHQKAICSNWKPEDTVTIFDRIIVTGLVINGLIDVRFLNRLAPQFPWKRNKRQIAESGCLKIVIGE